MKMLNDTVSRLHKLIRRLKARVAERTQALAALEERERLGRELHDGLGQVLGYIHLEAQTVQDFLAKGDIQAAQASLERLSQVARDAHADLRSLILGLRITIPPGKTLSDALRARLQQFNQDSGIKATLSWPEKAPTPAFAPAVEEQVLRIVQEALANVRKHAQARRVEVLFIFNDDQTQVIIADDGVGFNADHPLDELGGHFGLNIMRERAAQIGGLLQVRSVPNQGTKVILTVPRGIPADVPKAGDLAKGLRLLLVDDHPLFLDGLRNLLVARGLTVVGLARDGIEAQEQARLLHPDLVVMDLHMPRCDGLEATRAIKAELPDVKIVILTVSEEEEHLFEAIKNGASGYLLKSLDANEFVALLIGLARGEAPLAPGLAARILTEFAHRETAETDLASDQASLTPRQWEILQLVARGKAYKEVGTALHITERTVKYHMEQILQRLHLQTRAQAIAYAREMRNKSP